MIVKIVRVFEVEMPDDFKLKDTDCGTDERALAENEVWDKFNEDDDLVGEWIYPEGELPRDLENVLKEDL